MIFVNTHTFIPLYLNLIDLNVLVIGGGKVGTKRALNFYEHGAKVTVVSLNFSEELLNYKDKISLIKKDANDLDSNFLANFDIIITATNDKNINSKLCHEAKKLKKLCNNPTNIEESSFIVPIYYTDNELSIAVTTFGKSSLSSKYIIELIRKNILSDEIYELVKVMETVKELLKSEINDPSKRFTYYSKIFNDEIFRNYIKEKKLDLAIDRAKVIINE
ncbi:MULTISPECIES: precorrin-2 dehydrogenase/sirohydrochlorin ferrochelatase family protein [Sulfurisphaera]|uniref:precorrin-2 dehydrogenase n=2 Tax=Sulfurisphaera TaxID=69655 RepID=A0A650CDJ6_SULOH|nr:MULTISPECIES: bifunctional precorrin-2 dehydrogenase/sirohydrochlorin ferrochelatase [Sulfurisphaera]QGR15849.1 bifunctional precorrin-2 dehydrogenase/sirohydrochlorin ferrochelatase [Sulfurisphaera ohwakuensis]HII74334.1 bifunctional precorrin-2 dehydrogenase/sirohydrochlorin ferrochelatase [Sulfurisphaera tokodaii]